MEALSEAIDRLSSDGEHGPLSLPDIIPHSSQVRISNRCITDPSTTCSHRIPPASGKRRATQLVLTGRPISASQAHEFGLVKKVTLPNSYLVEAISLSQEVAAGPAGHSTRQEGRTKCRRVHR